MYQPRVGTFCVILVAFKVNRCLWRFFETWSFSPAYYIPEGDFTFSATHIYKFCVTFSVFRLSYSFSFDLFIHFGRFIFFFFDSLTYLCFSTHIRSFVLYLCVSVCLSTNGFFVVAYIPALASRFDDGREVDVCLFVYA